MALYHGDGRDPLLDDGTQALLERRGQELLGLALLAGALAFVAMLATYSPTDPGWMVATDAPAHNALGRFGASLASTLMIIGGAGAWAIPTILFAWGVRFVLHRGTERASGRIVFAVIAVAMTSVYSSTLVPGTGWQQSYGLGGLFGDTVVGALIGMTPGAMGMGLKLVSLVMGLGTVGMLLFVTGFDLAEMRTIAQVLMRGSVQSYSGLRVLADKGAEKTVQAAREVQGRRQTRVAQAAEFASPLRQARRGRDDAALAGGEGGTWGFPASLRAEMNRPDSGAGALGRGRAQPNLFDDDFGADDAAGDPLARDPYYAPQKGGFLSRMPGLMRRQPDSAAPPPVANPSPMAAMQPEWVESAAPDLDSAPDADRIRARITDAVRARRPHQAAVAGGSVISAAIARREPMVLRPLGRSVAPPQRALWPAEPPVVAPPRPIPPDAAPNPPEALFRAVARAPQPSPAPVDMPAPETPVFRHTDPVQTELPVVDFDPQPDDATFAPQYDAAEDTWLSDNWEPDPLAGYEPDPLPEPPRQPLNRAVIPDRRGVVQHPPKRAAAPSSRAMAEAQPRLMFDEATDGYELPPLSLLSPPERIERQSLSDEALEQNARMLETVLDDYGVKGEIVSVRPGPVVTMYELEPAPGLKASRVIGLSDDIARSMSALSARVSTVPGRSVIGIELPNVQREKVVLREILASRDFGDTNMRLPLALGKDIGGDPVVANLAKMPHLLIAGTTGSGKSVAINTMILSLLYKLTPEECRLIMIDPKMLELSVYDGIPHLLSPVVTDPKKAVVALKWVVGEMEERYRKMSKMGVRNIEGFNGRVRETLARGEKFRRTIQTGFDDLTGDPIFETEEFSHETLPYIVVIVDEMADLMMVAGKEIEACIQRLAQMARASGIHLIMATQRPSVDVITGTIKANFPTRISFQVTSKIDSRTILGEQGAEQLLGMGDMLYMAGGAKITRIHGPFVSDEEVEEIVNHLKSFGPPSYMSGVVEGPDEDQADDIDLVLGLTGSGDAEDALYDQAVAIVAKDRKCSTSYIQRKLGIGYNKAARLVEQMEEQGVVTPANHVGKREILIPEV